MVPKKEEKKFSFELLGVQVIEPPNCGNGFVPTRYRIFETELLTPSLFISKIHVFIEKGYIFKDLNDKQFTYEELIRKCQSLFRWL